MSWGKDWGGEGGEAPGVGKDRKARRTTTAMERSGTIAEIAHPYNVVGKTAKRNKGERWGGSEHFKGPKGIRQRGTANAAENRKTMRVLAEQGN